MAASKTSQNNKTTDPLKDFPPYIQELLRRRATFIRKAFDPYGFYTKVQRAYFHRRIHLLTRAIDRLLKSEGNK